MPLNKENVSQKEQKRREQKKLSMRRAREKLKLDKDKHEEVKRKDRERYHKKKEEGLVLGIKDLSRRDQKAQRNEWRERARRYRQKKRSNRILNEMLEKNTPPSTPVREFEMNNTPPSTSRIAAGKKVARRNREKWRKERNDLLKMLEAAKASKNKYKSRYYRLKKVIAKKTSTPEKEVSEMLAGQSVTPTVKRNLLCGEVLKKQIRQNFNQQKKKKDMFKKVLHGPLIKKYKLEKMLHNLTSRRSLNNKRQVINEKIFAARRAVVEFLEQDENSRITAGKKETITRKKVKKQIRYLSDSMKRLHAKFVRENTFKKISYSTFCSLRPFWIKFPNYKSRSTCLCKIHTNISLLVKRCKTDKIIPVNSPYELTRFLCCVEPKEECQNRSCQECRNKIIPTLDFAAEEMTVFEKWTTKKISVIIKGEVKICQKTLKESITCTKLELLKELNNNIIPYMKHCLAVEHQHKAVTNIKHSLTSEDVLIHMDFSENYECKYGEEVQSVHFGGSKQQISLHTVVVYHHQGHHCFCTLSENLKHDPLAICAHLKPILKSVKNDIPNLKTAYCLSDGPSTQYKNKTMFQLAIRYVAHTLNVTNFYWNYSASGHGKGAPDGVGGCIKRTADALVSQGRDINNFQKLYESLKENCKGINIIKINEDFDVMNKYIRNIDIAPFKGTLNIHQLSWSAIRKEELHARRLSCFQCQPGEKCYHYEIGVITVDFSQKANQKMSVDEVYTSSSESEKEVDFYPEKKNPEKDVKINSYVIIRVSGIKNTEQYFIGFVFSKKDDDIFVKFLKRCGGNKFTFPDQEDTAYVAFSDIIAVLTEPTVNNRQQYVFNSEELCNIKNLY